MPSAIKFIAFIEVLTIREGVVDDCMLLHFYLSQRVSRILCKRRLITAEAFFPQTE